MEAVRSSKTLALCQNLREARAQNITDLRTQKSNTFNEGSGTIGDENKFQP
jgi:hypothetical protein